MNFVNRFTLNRFGMRIDASTRQAASQLDYIHNICRVNAKWLWNAINNQRFKWNSARGERTTKITSKNCPSTADQVCAVIQYIALCVSEHAYTCLVTEIAW